MGHTYTTIVWNADIPRTDKYLLLAIADFMNDMGDGCFASYDRLAYKTGYSRRQVIETVAKLKEQGVIVFQGTHEKWKTSIWTLDESKLTKLLPYNDWLKETRKRNTETKENYLAELEGVQKPHPKECSLPRQGVQFLQLGSEVSAPNPESKPLYNSKGNLTAVSVETAFEITTSDEFSLEIPANERPNVDDEISYGDDELDEKPLTELEKKIVKLCNAKHITPPMRRKLNSEVFAAQGKQRPQNYPSPEAEWKENPDQFNAYVEDCARIQRNNTSRPPGRDALIGLIRNYARHKTGWLDFRDFKEVEAAPAKQAEGKYYENRPKRPVFGEKPRL